MGLTNGTRALIALVVAVPVLLVVSGRAVWNRCFEYMIAPVNTLRRRFPRSGSSISIPLPQVNRRIYDNWLDRIWQGLYDRRQEPLNHEMEDSLGYTLYVLFEVIGLRIQDRIDLHLGNLYTERLVIKTSDYENSDLENLERCLAINLPPILYTTSFYPYEFLLKTSVPLSEAQVQYITAEAQISPRITLENSLLKHFSESGNLESALCPPTIVEPVLLDTATSLRLTDLRPQCRDTEILLQPLHDLRPTKDIRRRKLYKLIKSVRDSANGPQVQLVVIKRVYPNSDPHGFAGLKQRLCKVNQLQHPNLVETIAAFISTSESTPEERLWNLVWPVPYYDLRQLLDGQSLDPVNIPVAQLEALASALAYLHETLKIAHRSIRASNILVYKVPGSSRHVLKLASFSSSVDLTHAYTLIEQSKVDPKRVWMLDTVFGNDVLTLGCVFVELVTFLVKRTAGVVDLGKRITTGEVGTLDASFYNKECGRMRTPILEVKPQVFEWMSDLSKSSFLAEVAFSIIEKMLGKVGQERITARQVCEGFIKALDLHLFDSDHEFSDGLQSFKFTSALKCKQPDLFDRLRAGLERQVDHAIDWSPFPPVDYVCQQDEMRVDWTLHKIISSASARRLMDMCRGLLATGTPLLPVNKLPGEDQQTALNSGVPDDGNNARVLESIRPTEIELTEQRSKEIYLCVDRILVEFPETKMCPISNVQNLPDDEALFVKMREQLRSCNGWFKNMLSWKTCTRIKFVKFAVIKDRRVKALGFGRPIGHVEYEYTRSNHQAEDPEAYLDIIAEEVLWGIHNIGAGRDETHVTDEIPKKRNPPKLLEVRGTEAYGVQAMQGLSLRRVCWWSAVSYTLGLAFVVFWLSFVDKLDLQTAFVPVTFLATMLVGALAANSGTRVRLATAVLEES